MRAVLLLSGGLDSYTAGAIAKSQGFTLFALTIGYGQRHARELESARAVARALGVERHLELAIDLRAIGGSSLTSGDAVPTTGTSARPAFRRRTCRRATRSFSRSRSGGLKSSARTTSSPA